MIRMEPFVPFRCFSSLNGVFKTIKSADALLRTFDANINLPFFSVLNPNNSNEAGFVVFEKFHIFRIPALSDITKIGKAVIGSIAVYMVNNIFWPFAGMNGPCHAMSENSLVEHAPNQISFLKRCKRPFSNMNCCPSRKGIVGGKVALWPSLPRQYSRLWVIREDLTQCIR